MEEWDMAALVRHEVILVSRSADPELAGSFVQPAREGASACATPACTDEIARLYEALDQVSEHDHPRTARLLAAGRRKMAQKLIEEAAEVALEASRHHSRSVVRESADLLYQLVVLWRDCGIAPEEIWEEMRRRVERFGIAEKLPKRRQWCALELD
jgi:phosphoribosyl-ATP pyrophosphohydrolase